MNGFAQLTIGKRLALGFGGVLAMVLTITVVGIQKVKFIDDTLQSLEPTSKAPACFSAPNG